MHSYVELHSTILMSADDLNLVQERDLQKRDCIMFMSPSKQNDLEVVGTFLQQKLV